MSTPNLQGIPLEIRDLIYRDLLSLPSGLQTILLLPHQNITPNTESQCCSPWYSPSLTCHQLRHEISAFARRQTIQISTKHDSKDLHTNVNIPCLCGFGSRILKPKISIHINPLQQRETIPGVYASLLSLTRRLCKIPGLLPEVKIYLDGSLPPPLLPNELDLQRAPLNMIVLLFPFRLLRGVKSAGVFIAGDGPLKIWPSSEKYIFLYEFAERVYQDMQAEELKESADSNCIVADLITALECALRDDDGIICKENRLADLVGLGRYPLRDRSRAGNSFSSDRALERLDELCGFCGHLFRSEGRLTRHQVIFHGGTEDTGAVTR
ncbi:hypothetical protein QBC37DRAFT_86647 [Rhypophila decipiens]|uniref:C2H2-type domain-containing protein n=1 Tax=Rhypophila decipiens TaxID=261697 RepID=A0AAN6XY91_9PEZI|nr:hypothetical protein QBC37DRAFT_86647 [Rhypophila decipiens]